MTENNILDVVRSTNEQLSDILSKSRKRSTTIEVVDTYKDILQMAANKIIEQSMMIKDNSSKIVILQNRIDQQENRIEKLENRIELLENQSKLLSEMNNHLNAIKSNIPIIENAKYLIVAPSGIFYVFSTEDKIAKYFGVDIRIVRQALANKSTITEESSGTPYTIFKVSELVSQQ